MADPQVNSNDRSNIGAVGNPELRSENVLQLYFKQLARKYWAPQCAARPSTVNAESMIDEANETVPAPDTTSVGWAIESRAAFPGLIAVVIVRKNGAENSNAQLRAPMEVWNLQVRLQL